MKGKKNVILREILGLNDISLDLKLISLIETYKINA
jgi:hypothetical protein